MPGARKNVVSADPLAESEWSLSIISWWQKSDVSSLPALVGSAVMAMGKSMLKRARRLCRNSNTSKCDRSSLVFSTFSPRLRMNSIVRHNCTQSSGVIAAQFEVSFHQDTKGFFWCWS
eukprot:6650305-Ditylum_brightwellii.AAC.1